MALTPRSFFKSPTLLVAAIVSAGIAMIGAAIFVSAFCTSERSTKCQRTAKQIDRLEPLRSASCNYVLAENGDNLANWAHQDWVDLAACFERAGDNDRAATTAAWGIGFYPTSEMLHNIRGYNLIVQEKYDEAVIALRVSLQSVETTDGTLQNNLAWAGLFASNLMTLSEARRHYEDSLALDGSSCEALHTGMWTEYGIASRSSGTSRDRAMATYIKLRQKYEPCLTRADHGDRMTRFEVAGAGILDHEMAKISMVQMFEKADSRAIAHSLEKIDPTLVKRSVSALELSHADIDDACEDIAPVRSALPACRKAMQAAISCNR